MDSPEQQLESQGPSQALPPPRFARHVAVAGRRDRDESSAPHRQRRVTHRVLQLSAARSADEQLQLVGWMLLALVTAHLVLAGVSALGLPGWLWRGAATVAGAALVAPPWRRRRSAAGRRLIALVALASALAALPAGLPAQPSAWTVWVGTFAVAAAAVVAPSAPAVVAAAAAPLLALIAAAVAGGLSSASPAAPIELAAALWASTLAAALGWRLHLGWRQQALQAIEQGDRVLALQAERDTAQRNDSDKSRFLAIASHDLRQPVHALGLFAATLHKRLMNSPDEPLGRNLMRSVDSLERSFNAMLDISRLDGGALTPKMQNFPLRDLFRRLHMQYGGQAELAGLGLRFCPGGKSVTSDPQLLERIVGNLVQNAIRYTTAGGVVVVARTTRTHVNVEVWDTGCGVAAADLQRIFDEFYQVGRGERDRSQGLGMGLAIVKRLAALLQHRLEVVSTPGRGTMFRLGVPVVALEGLAEETAAADTLPMSVDKPQMVLVVDDEEPIREGLRVLLQEWGYQVMAAADAAQAERAVSALEGRIDLIVTDLHLGPGPGGQEVVASVRRLCAREVPAVLVTGDTAGEALRVVAAGADPVLFKPVQPRHLFEAMQAALDRPATPREPKPSTSPD